LVEFFLASPRDVRQLNHFLGAAAIGPSALISPAKSHPEVEVYAIAARDKTRAEAYAKKNGIPMVFGSYQGTLVIL
jgi:predicted dehydrogenase